MNIKLSGINVDIEALTLSIGEISPETIVAAYSRVSRKDLPINELREESYADLDKARKSCDKIIHTLGHESVAEHAVFSFDIMGVSRLAVEFIEGFRLCSFTEKSQRYQRMDGADYIFPISCSYTVETKSAYKKYMEFVLNSYKEIVSCGIKPEDARYVLPLTMHAQLGMTANARNLILTIQRAMTHPLAEVRSFGDNLYKQLKEIAPSIFSEKILVQDKMSQIYSILHDKFKDVAHGHVSADSVTLLNHTQHGDLVISQALIHRATSLSMNEIQKLFLNINGHQFKDIFNTVFKLMNKRNSLPREFEHASATFEIQGSASWFAQLKRHRMASISPQQYWPGLGYVIPESISNNNKAFRVFLSVMQASNEEYIKNPTSAESSYVLTNAHKRRVIITMNYRDLYNFAKLRMDPHAQWEIRATATEMINKMKEKSYAMSAAYGANERG